MHSWDRLEQSCDEPLRPGSALRLPVQGSERCRPPAIRRGPLEAEVGQGEGRGPPGALPHLPRSAELREQVHGCPGCEMVAGSLVMRQLIDSVRRLSPKDVTVLVRGETGTGKEVIASLLHDWSRRSVRRFVRFNCAAIPDELAESALFGHVRGAFTGAVEERRGYFAEADGGTLVLDEVGDLPLTVQGTLLRALQDGEIQRVGAGRTERVDVRVIACTNRDLRAMVEAGRFREDLYYRLAVVELFVPPLRDRREDIPALVAEFARRYARRFGMAELRLSAELVGTLQRAAWPGNVRQLENAVARLAAFSEDGGLPEGIPIAPTPPAGAPGTTPELGAADGEPRALVALDADLTLREQMEVVEREIIARALTRAGGNRSEAARRLALSRSAFHAKLRKLSLAGESDPK